MPGANLVSYGRAMPFWRNILEVAREERLAAMRNRTAAVPSDAVEALVARPEDQEIPAPSTDALEVFEVTVLDVAPASAP